MREFIAVELSEEAREEAERVKRLIENSGVIKAKFVEKENLHLTLRFLGEITEKEEEMLGEALRSVSMKRFEARLGNIGVFGKGRNIRTVWVALTGDEIFNLRDRINRSIADMFPLMKKDRFESHVTLSRVKEVEDAKKLFEFLNLIDVKKIGFLVNEFVLKRSTLTSNGSVYEDVEKFRLD